MVAWSSLAPLVGLTLSAVAGVSAQDTPAEPSAKPLLEDVPGAFIVEFEGDYDADALVNDLRGEKLDAEKRLNLKYKLFNGASVNVNGTGDAEETAAKIVGHQKVKRVWPVRKISMPMDRVQSIGNGSARASAEMVARRGNIPYNSTYSTHVMGQVQKLHAEGFTGKGIRISVIDSGVDYTHPALGGCFGPGCKVSYGYDLIGDDLADFPKPDPDPMEACFGHGTHVSGIIGANPNDMGFQGVAPDAEMGMFRALNCLGSSSNEILMAAFNMAFDAGSDIITSSTGILGGWEDDPWSLTATRIAAAGVPILIAAGNDGEKGMAQASNPASGRGVASVASIDNTDIPRIFTAGTYQVDGGDAEQFPYQAAVYVPMGNLTLPLVMVKDQSGAMLDACGPLPDGVPSLADVIALIGTGSCTMEESAVNVKAKGGKHMIRVHTTDDSLGFYFPPGAGMSGVAVTTASQGKKWATAFAAGHNITVTTRDVDKSPSMAVHMPAAVSGGYTSYWSTWGPSWQMGINPNLAAPGGEILSTFPQAVGTYAVLSGTSMATPYAAGVAALLMQKRGVRDSETIRALLASTSKQLVSHDGQRPDPAGRLHSVLQSGPGMMQAWDASEVKGVLSTAGISFNDTAHIRDMTFSLRNTGSAEATYELGHRPAGTVYAYDVDGVNYAYPVRLADEVGATAQLSFPATGDLVTVPAGGSVDITVRCAPPSGLAAARLPFYSGFVTLNGTNGDALTLQYQGVAASLAEQPVMRTALGPTGLPTTYMTASDSHWPIPTEDDHVFRVPRPTNPPNTRQTGSWPQARITMTLGVREFALRVVSLDGGNATAAAAVDWFGHRTLGTVYYNPALLLPRDQYRRSFLGLLSDGTVVPEGRYRLLATALRLFGDREKEEDWQVLELGPFKLQYL
ncbi:hypothetical protein RB595_008912 [Gaeumannomyces hyphopodioides]